MPAAPLWQVLGEQTRRLVCCVAGVCAGDTNLVHTWELQKQRDFIDIKTLIVHP